MRPFSLRQSSKRAVALSSILALIATLTVALVTPAAAAPNCPDVVVIGARGSGEAPQWPAPTNASSRFEGIGKSLHKTYASLKKANPALKFEALPVDYPAVNVPLLISPIGFPNSVAPGITNTLVQIHSVVSRGCNITPKIVLMGYSQGALVITTALSQLQPSAEKDAIAGIYMIGDPLYDASKAYSKGGMPGGGNGLIATLRDNTSLSFTIWGTLVKVYPADLVNLIGGTAPVPPEFADRTYDYCLKQDPMCQPEAAGKAIVTRFFTFRGTPHDHYKDTPNTQAIDWLTTLIKKPEIKMTISPQTGPTGTVLTLAGLCPVGSTNVGVDETLAVHDRISSAKVNSNGTWTIQQGTFTSNQPDVNDPATKQKVWGPINWNLHVTCSGNGVAHSYPDAKWTGKAGKAIKTTIVPTATGFTVTVTPGSPCPFPSSVAVVTVSTNPADYSSFGDSVKGSAYVNNNGNWPAVAVSAKKYPSGTLIDIGASCYRATILDQIDFVYYFQHSTQPAS